MHHGQGQHRMEQTQYMDVVETLFCLTDADGCPEMRCQQVFVSMRSVCAVSGSVVRPVLHSACHVLATGKETWLEQHFRATDHNSKLAEQQHAG